MQASREALAQLLFEQFNVAGFYVAEAPILSLYAAGKLTGTAVDVGAEKIGAAAARAVLGLARAAAHARAADICPVYEGMMVGPGARRIELGGADIDVHLQHLLKARCVASRVRACVPRERSRGARARRSGVDVELPEARAIKEQYASVCEVRAPRLFGARRCSVVQF